MNNKTASNYFIYRLKQYRGLGNIGILKILSEAEKRECQEFTLEELIFFGKIKSQHIAAFCQSYYDFQDKSEEHYWLFSNSSFFTILDDIYPEYLAEIYNPPVMLFYKGNLQLLRQPKIAIVGSRNATNHGETVLRKLLPELVKAKLTIVSGMARGIDTLAHQETIRQGGQTIGVIGCGLNVVYPKENFRLQKFMGEQQLLLSEYPPDDKPLSYHFPERNRIIAGLSLGTCIVEAKERSGSLITAEIAMEEGREVFAVPGDVLSGYSTGCHKLIQQGAKCVWNGQNIIEEIRFLIKKA